MDELTDTEQDAIWQAADDDAIHGWSNAQAYEVGPKRDFYEFALRQAAHKHH